MKTKTAKEIIKKMDISREQKRIIETLFYKTKNKYKKKCRLFYSEKMRIQQENRSVKSLKEEIKNSKEEIKEAKAIEAVKENAISNLRAEIRYLNEKNKKQGEEIGRLKSRQALGRLP